MGDFNKRRPRAWPAAFGVAIVSFASFTSAIPLASVIMGIFGKADEVMGKSKRSNVTEIRVPFRDVDMNGQMFLASYISYAESVLADFWSMRPDVDDEPVYSVSKVSCVFHRPLGYDEAVTFTALVDKIGVRSVGFIIAVETGGDERSAEVEIIWQARDPVDQSPIALPEETRDWLYGFLV